MSDDSKIDLSALDPTRDRLRFERLVRSVAARAAERRAPDSLSVIVRNWRPALALAACLAVAIWAPAALRSSDTPSATPQTKDPAALLLTWASSGVPSRADEILQSLGRAP